MKCIYCHGTGLVKEWDIPRNCSECDGSGEMDEELYKARILDEEKRLAEKIKCEIIVFEAIKESRK